jgi:hypothetical protein
MFNYNLKRVRGGANSREHASWQACNHHHQNDNRPLAHKTASPQNKLMYKSFDWVLLRACEALEIYAVVVSTQPPSCRRRRRCRRHRRRTIIVVVVPSS